MRVVRRNSILSHREVHNEVVRLRMLILLSKTERLERHILKGLKLLTGLAGVGEEKGVALLF